VKWMRSLHSATVALRLQVLSDAVIETWLPHQKYHMVGSTDGRRLQYYNSQMYLTSRAPANMAAGFGMNEKLLGGNGAGSVFQQTGFGDPGSPMGYCATAGLQYKPTASLHNGIRTHHEASAGLTHRPPSAASVPLLAAGAALVYLKIMPDA